MKSPTYSMQNLVPYFQPETNLNCHIFWAAEKSGQWLVSFKGLPYLCVCACACVRVCVCVWRERKRDLFPDSFWSLIFLLPLPRKKGLRRGGPLRSNPHFMRKVLGKVEENKGEKVAQFSFPEKKNSLLLMIFAQKSFPRNHSGEEARKIFQRRGLNGTTERREQSH